MAYLCILRCDAMTKDLVSSCSSRSFLQWRHKERDGVSNHRRLHCLLKCWLQAQIKENIKRPVALSGKCLHLMTSSCVYDLKNCNCMDQMSYGKRYIINSYPYENSIQNYHGSWLRWIHIWRYLITSFLQLWLLRFQFMTEQALTQWYKTLH